MQLDQLDLDLLNLLLEEPQAGMREYARVLGVARGTVQARLARLEREGVISGHAPAISPAGLGFIVQAFVHLYLAQGQLDNVVARLGAIPEVLEAHTTTGEGDLLCRVAARSNLHLEEIVQDLLALPGRDPHQNRDLTQPARRLPRAAPGQAAAGVPGPASAAVKTLSAPAPGG